MYLQFCKTASAGSLRTRIVNLGVFHDLFSRFVTTKVLVYRQVFLPVLRGQLNNMALTLISKGDLNRAALDFFVMFRICHNCRHSQNNH